MHLISSMGIFNSRDQNITVLDEKSLIFLIVSTISSSGKFRLTHLTASRLPLSNNLLITKYGFFPGFNFLASQSQKKKCNEAGSLAGNAFFFTL